MFNENNAKFRLSGDGAGDTFILNEIGELLVVKKLDRETISSYMLKAQIIDARTGRKLEEDTEFTIQVQDINDNAPVFSETYIGFVEERARRGTKLTSILNVLMIILKLQLGILSWSTMLLQFIQYRSSTFI